MYTPPPQKINYAVPIRTLLAACVLISLASCTIENTGVSKKTTPVVNGLYKTVDISRVSFSIRVIDESTRSPLARANIFVEKFEKSSSTNEQIRSRQSVGRTNEQGETPSIALGDGESVEIQIDDFVSARLILHSSKLQISVPTRYLDPSKGAFYLTEEPYSRQIECPKTNEIVEIALRKQGAPSGSIEKLIRSEGK